MSEVRGLRSAGITRPRRSYGPVRLPLGPPSKRRRWSSRSTRNGSPPITRIALPTCRVQYPGGSRGGACRSLPARAAFPVFQAGRHPHWPFRGLLGLHSHYGPPDRSTAQGGLCHEAPAQRITPPNRSSASRAIDYSLGGTYLHWRYAPSGRTGKAWRRNRVSLERLGKKAWRPAGGPLRMDSSAFTTES